MEILLISEGEHEVAVLQLATSKTDDTAVAAEMKDTHRKSRWKLLRQPTPTRFRLYDAVSHRSLWLGG